MTVRFGLATISFTFGMNANASNLSWDGGDTELQV
jgi:hypothetical protein